jgi:hypothetical protein
LTLIASELVKRCPKLRDLSVPVGRNPVTQRYHYAYDHASSREEAERKRDAMIERIAEGREPLNKATVNELIDRWMTVAELELSTRVSYEGYIERVIRPVQGKMRLRKLEIRVDILDVLNAELRAPADQPAPQVTGGLPPTHHEYSPGSSSPAGPRSRNPVRRQRPPGHGILLRAVLPLTGPVESHAGA